MVQLLIVLILILALGSLAEFNVNLNINDGHDAIHSRAGLRTHNRMFESRMNAGTDRWSKFIGTESQHALDSIRSENPNLVVHLVPEVIHMLSILIAHTGADCGCLSGFHGNNGLR